MPEDAQTALVRQMIEGLRPRRPQGSRQERARQRRKAVAVLNEMIDAGRAEEAAALAREAADILYARNAGFYALEKRLETVFARASAVGPQGPKGLAAWFVSAVLDSRLSWRIDMEVYVPWLGEAGLAEATRIAEERRLDPEARQEDDWEERSRQLPIRDLLVELAKASGDVDKAISLLADPGYNSDIVDIVELLWEAGRDDEAEAWARPAMARECSFELDPIREQLADRLLAAGRRDEAVAIPKAMFDDLPSHLSYRTLRRIAQEAGQWDELRDWVLDRARYEAGHRPSYYSSSSCVYMLIRIFLDEDMLDEAWAAAIAVPDDVHWSLWPELIGLREKEHPADVLEPLATLIEDDTWRLNTASQYRKLIGKIERLRDNCERAGDPASFDEYLAGLRERRKRKRTLIAALDSAFGDRGRHTAPDPSGHRFPASWPKMTREGLDVRNPDPGGAAREDITLLCSRADTSSMSLAESYALGQATTRMVDSRLSRAMGDEWPKWLKELDPLEVLFLGAAHLKDLDQPYMFANCCDEWLRMLRATEHWEDVETLVREALAMSERLVLPVNDPQVILMLGSRLEAAGLNQRKLPPEMMPRVFLNTARSLIGPGSNMRLPDPPPHWEKKVAEFWQSLQTRQGNDGTVHDALQMGLRFTIDLGHDPAGQKPMFLLNALYFTIAGAPDEPSDELNDRVLCWALGLLADSPLAPVIDVILTASKREITMDATLGHLFGLPGFAAQVRDEDRILRTAPNGALSKVAAELGLISTSGLLPAWTFHKDFGRLPETARSLGPSWVILVRTQAALGEHGCLALRFGMTGGRSRRWRRSWRFTLIRMTRCC